MLKKCICFIFSVIVCFYAVSAWPDLNHGMPLTLTVTPPFALRGRDLVVTFNCSAASARPAIEFSSVTVLCNGRPLPSACRTSYALNYCSHSCNISLLESADCLCAIFHTAQAKLQPASHASALYIGSTPKSPRLADCEWNESLVMGSPFLCNLRPSLLELERQTGLPPRAAELSLNVSFAHWANGYAWRQCRMGEATVAAVATASLTEACPSGELCCNCDAASLTPSRPQRCAWLAADSEDFANETLFVRLSVCNRIGWCSSKSMVLLRSVYKRPLPLLINATFALSATGDSVLAWVLPLPQLRHLTTTFDTEVFAMVGNRLLARNSTQLEAAPLSLPVPPMARVQLCARRRAVDGQHWSQPACLTARSPATPLLCPPAQSFVDADGRHLWIGQSDPSCLSSPAEAAAAAAAAANRSACVPALPSSGGLVQCRCQHSFGLLRQLPAPAACLPGSLGGRDSLPATQMPSVGWWRRLRLTPAHSAASSVAGTGLSPLMSVSRIQPVLLLCHGGGFVPGPGGAACPPGQLLLLLRANSLQLSGPLLRLSCSAPANRSAAASLAAGCWQVGDGNGGQLACLAPSACLLESDGGFSCPKLASLAGALGCSIESEAPSLTPAWRHWLLLLLLPAGILASSAACWLLLNCYKKILFFCRRLKQPVPPARDYGPEPGSAVDERRVSGSCSTSNAVKPLSDRTQSTTATSEADRWVLQMEIADGYRPWSDRSGS